jgi:TIR domain
VYDLACDHAPLATRRWFTMADIFISYSKTDHALALKLSAFLESEGWTVWWDKSLAAADHYRDDIMKQLVAARAVITIWTPNSIKSDWVRAEAGRAKANGKLIPVKTRDVAYADIPLPFGEMHTENVGSTELIRAAVVAQLAKPAVTPSPFWQITSTFKYTILTWIGIIGSAITLFANLNGALDFADWARVFVDQWQEWTQMFWGWVFSLVNIRVPKPVVPIISFIASVGILVAAVNLSARTVKSTVNLRHSPSVARKVCILGGGVLLVLLELVIIVPLVFIILQGPLAFVSQAIKVAIVVVMLLALVGIPAGYLVCFSKERLLAGVNSLLFIIMTFCLLYLPLQRLPDVESEGYFELGVILLFPICWMAVILFSPLQQLTKRLGFVVLGVAILIGLSEISKLNLHQYLQPPKASEILR